MYKFYKKIISILILSVFVVTQILQFNPSCVYAQSLSAISSEVINLPAPGAVVGLTNDFFPAMIRGLQIYPENPLKFNFFIDQGDFVKSLEDQVPIKKQEEYNKLIKYFLASLTIPEEDLWVNLSPYEANRIIADEFGETEMGRDLLAQDYMLKQLSASLISPENKIGQEFWERIYSRIHDQAGQVDLPKDLISKIWIVPESAVVYESGDSAFLVESKMKVMVEQDYLAMKRIAVGEGFKPSPTGQDYNIDIIREIVIPAIEQEVNHGKIFANLRQINDALILAEWYKQALKDGLLSRIYVDQNKIVGVDIRSAGAIHESPVQQIYNQYIEALKLGVSNLIKEEYDPIKQEIVARKYFTGGYSARNGTNLSQSIKRTTDVAQLSNVARTNLTKYLDELKNGDVNLDQAMVVLAEGEKKNNIQQSAVMDGLVDGMSKIEIDEYNKRVEEKFNNSGSKIKAVDFMTGDGQFLVNSRIADPEKDIIGYDVNAYGKLKVDNFPRGIVFRDVVKTGISDNSVDEVTINMSPPLVVLENLELILKEVKRILKPQGTIKIVFQNVRKQDEDLIEQLIESAKTNISDVLQKVGFDILSEMQDVPLSDVFPDYPKTRDLELYEREENGANLFMAIKPSGKEASGKSMGSKVGSVNILSDLSDYAMVSGYKNVLSPVKKFAKDSFLEIKNAILYPAVKKSLIDTIYISSESNAPDKKFEIEFKGVMTKLPIFKPVPTGVILEREIKYLSDIVKKLIIDQVKKGVDEEITSVNIYNVSQNYQTRSFIAEWGKKKYVIKRSQNHQTNGYIENQSNILKKLNADGGHPDIANLLISGTADMEIAYMRLELLNYLVTDFFEGDTLLNILNESKILDSKTTAKIAYQLAQLLKFIHKRGVIVRDLATRNIILKDINSGRVGLFDFDVSFDESYDWEKDPYILHSIPNGFYHNEYFESFDPKGDRLPNEMTDIYTIGMYLFNALTGKMFYEGEQTEYVGLEIIKDEKLKDIFSHMIGSRRNYSRYEHVEELVSDLEKYLRVNNLIDDVLSSNSDQAMVVKDENEYVRDVNPSWDNPAIQAIAKDIYDNKLRNFEQLPQEEVEKMFPGNVRGKKNDFKVYYHKENKKIQIIEKVEGAHDDILEFSQLQKKYAVPTFVIEGDNARHFELNLKPLGYVVLSEFLKIARRVHASDFESRAGLRPYEFSKYVQSLFNYDNSNKAHKLIDAFLPKDYADFLNNIPYQIGIIAEQTFRSNPREWFLHRHLHYGNVMVKANLDGSFDDVKFIDWSYLEKVLLSDFNVQKGNSLNDIVEQVKKRSSWYSNVDLEFYAEVDKTDQAIVVAKDAKNNVGGIDLNPANLKLQIKRDKGGVPLPIEFQDISNIQIEGFTPIILEITPVTTLPMFIGLKERLQGALVHSG